MAVELHISKEEKLRSKFCNPRFHPHLNIGKMQRALGKDQIRGSCISRQEIAAFFHPSVEYSTCAM